MVTYLMEHLIKEKLKHGGLAGSDQNNCSKPQNPRPLRARAKATADAQGGQLLIRLRPHPQGCWTHSQLRPVFSRVQKGRHTELHKRFQKSSRPCAIDVGSVTRWYQLTCMNRPLLANRETLTSNQ